MALVTLKVLEGYWFSKFSQDDTINGKLEIHINLHLFVLDLFLFFIQNSWYFITDITNKGS